jgi:hypothetical protein
MPGFDINQFRTAIPLDGARPNLFLVTMQFPPGLTSDGLSASRQLTFTCRSSQLPGSTLGQVPIQYFGREVKIAGNRTFPDWTLTVYADEDFLTRKAFEQWMASLNTHTTNLRQGNARNSLIYGVDAKVEQFGKGGDVIKTYNFVGCWPVDLSPIDLDWGTNDTIEEYTVTLAYQYWTDAKSGIR